MATTLGGLSAGLFLLRESGRTHESGSRRLTEEAIDKYAALYKVKTYEIFDLRGTNE